MMVFIMTKQVKDVWALRLDKKEKDMLEFLAEKQGIPMSAVVRQLIRRSYNGGLRSADP